MHKHSDAQAGNSLGTPQVLLQGTWQAVPTALQALSADSFAAPLSRLGHPYCCLVCAITMSMLQVVARVVEPRISDITIERIDDSDRPIPTGIYPDSVYTREISSYFKVRLSELPFAAQRGGCCSRSML